MVGPRPRAVMVGPRPRVLLRPPLPLVQQEPEMHCNLPTEPWRWVSVVIPRHSSSCSCTEIHFWSLPDSYFRNLFFWKCGEQTLQMTGRVPFTFKQFKSQTLSHSRTSSSNHMPCPIPVQTVQITDLVSFPYKTVQITGRVPFPYKQFKPFACFIAVQTAQTICHVPFPYKQFKPHAMSYFRSNSSNHRSCLIPVQNSSNHRPCPIPIQTVQTICHVPLPYKQLKPYAMSHSRTNSSKHMPCPIPVHFLSPHSAVRLLKSEMLCGVSLCWVFAGARQTVYNKQH
jgi:hypothetical protein